MQVEDEKIVLVKRSASTLQCSLCPNKYQGSLSITEHVINVHKLAHNVIAKWALSAAYDLEQGKVVANIYLVFSVFWVMALIIS